MSVRKSDDFIADVERQFEWYVVNAGWEVAEQYVVMRRAVHGHRDSPRRLLEPPEPEAQ